MIITLIGYRGCGKSSLAPLLAESRGWTWLDADREIEHRAGRSIAEIFATDGEAMFRELETDLLRDLYRLDHMVIATGGGAILNPETRQRMRENGPVLWLQADVDTLLSRIQGDPTTASSRPSLTNLPAREEVERVLTERFPLYEEASHIQLDTSSQSPEELAKEADVQISKLENSWDKQQG
ncbi:shikimate kinase [Rubinisphaera sp. JC750]|uniref:shikimate kinase n=1 Tax=Rubinisphaera sp. JC750 TaxID=2898658 RepID=UPI001F3D0CE2|nr:shikimate kinase [Rubinisphaera sp. JC750]